MAKAAAVLEASRAVTATMKATASPAEVRARQGGAPLAGQGLQKLLEGGDSDKAAHSARGRDTHTVLMRKLEGEKVGDGAWDASH